MASGIAGPAISTCAHLTPSSTNFCRNAAAVHAPPYLRSSGCEDKRLTPCTQNEWSHQPCLSSTPRVRNCALQFFCVCLGYWHRPHSLVGALASLFKSRHHLPIVAEHASHVVSKSHYTSTWVLKSKPRVAWHMVSKGGGGGSVLVSPQLTHLPLAYIPRGRRHPVCPPPIEAATWRRSRGLWHPGNGVASPRQINNDGGGDDAATPLCSFEHSNERTNIRTTRSQQCEQDERPW